MNALSELWIEDRGGAVVVRVTGELDISEASNHEERIAEAVPSTAPTVVIDLTELQFIDSSGVAMLFSLARQFDVRRQQLHVVASPGGLVARVLELVQLQRAARIHAELEDALAEGAGTE